MCYKHTEDISMQILHLFSVMFSIHTELFPDGHWQQTVREFWRGQGHPACPAGATSGTPPGPGTSLGPSTMTGPAPLPSDGCCSKTAAFLCITVEWLHERSGWLWCHAIMKTSETFISILSLYTHSWMKAFSHVYLAVHHFMAKTGTGHWWKYYQITALIPKKNDRRRNTTYSSEQRKLLCRKRSFWVLYHCKWCYKIVSTEEEEHVLAV